jgi:hypothetical protein
MRSEINLKNYVNTIEAVDLRPTVIFILYWKELGHRKVLTQNHSFVIGE